MKVLFRGYISMFGIFNLHKIRMHFIFSFLIVGCLSNDMVFGYSLKPGGRENSALGDDILDDVARDILQKLKSPIADVYGRSSPLTNVAEESLLMTDNAIPVWIAARKPCYQGCPDGWVSFNASCYLFGSENLNFAVAQAYCQQRESHLVSVETTDESAFLKIFMKSIEGEQKSASYWLGLTEDAATDSWVLQKGDTKATFFDWGPGEPNEGRNEGCVWFQQIKGYQWADVTCSRTTRPVCEKRKTTIY